MRSLRAIALVLLSIPVALLAQTDSPDTVFVKRNMGNDVIEIDTLYIDGGSSQPQVLVGTMMLPSSDKLVSLLGHGISALSLEMLGECDKGSDTYDHRNKYPVFNRIERSGDLLTIDVTVSANCCHNFLGEAQVVGGNILDLVYTSYGMHCACTCCFQLRYTFDTGLESEYGILEKVMVNGNRETMGRIPE